MARSIDDHVFWMLTTMRYQEGCKLLLQNHIKRYRPPNDKLLKTGQGVCCRINEVFGTTYASTRTQLMDIAHVNLSPTSQFAPYAGLVVKTDCHLNLTAAGDDTPFDNINDVIKCAQNVNVNVTSYYVVNSCEQYVCFESKNFKLIWHSSGDYQMQCNGQNISISKYGFPNKMTYSHHHTVAIVKLIAKLNACSGMVIEPGIKIKKTWRVSDSIMHARACRGDIGLIQTTGKRQSQTCIECQRQYQRAVVKKDTEKENVGMYNTIREDLCQKNTNSSYSQIISPKALELLVKTTNIPVQTVDQNKFIFIFKIEETDIFVAFPHINVTIGRKHEMDLSTFGFPPVMECTLLEVDILIQFFKTVSLCRGMVMEDFDDLNLPTESTDYTIHPVVGEDGELSHVLKHVSCCAILVMPKDGACNECNTLFLQVKKKPRPKTYNVNRKVQGVPDLTYWILKNYEHHPMSGKTYSKYDMRMELRTRHYGQESLSKKGYPDWKLVDDQISYCFPLVHQSLLKNGNKMNEYYIDLAKRAIDSAISTQELAEYLETKNHVTAVKVTDDSIDFSVTKETHKFRVTIPDLSLKIDDCEITINKFGFPDRLDLKISKVDVILHFIEIINVCSGVTLSKKMAADKTMKLVPNLILTVFMDSDCAIHYRLRLKECEYLTLADTCMFCKHIKTAGDMSLRNEKPQTDILNCTVKPPAKSTRKSTKQTKKKPDEEQKDDLLFIVLNGKAYGKHCRRRADILIQGPGYTFNMMPKKKYDKTIRWKCTTTKTAKCPCIIIQEGSIFTLTQQHRHALCYQYFRNMQKEHSESIKFKGRLKLQGQDKSSHTPAAHQVTPPEISALVEDVKPEIMTPTGPFKMETEISHMPEQHGLMESQSNGEVEVKTEITDTSQGIVETLWNMEEKRVKTEITWTPENRQTNATSTATPGLLEMNNTPLVPYHSTMPGAVISKTIHDGKSHCSTCRCPFLKSRETGTFTRIRISDVASVQTLIMVFGYRKYPHMYMCVECWDFLHSKAIKNKVKPGPLQTWAVTKKSTHTGFDVHSYCKPMPAGRPSDSNERKSCENKETIGIITSDGVGDSTYLVRDKSDQVSNDHTLNESERGSNDQVCDKSDRLSDKQVHFGTASDIDDSELQEHDTSSPFKQVGGHVIINQLSGKQKTAHKSDNVTLPETDSIIVSGSQKRPVGKRKDIPRDLVSNAEDIVSHLGDSASRSGNIVPNEISDSKRIETPDDIISQKPFDVIMESDESDGSETDSCPDSIPVFYDSDYDICLDDFDVCHNVVLEDQNGSDSNIGADLDPGCIKLSSAADKIASHLILPTCGENTCESAPVKLTEKEPTEMVSFVDAFNISSLPESSSENNSISIDQLKVSSNEKTVKTKHIVSVDSKLKHSIDENMAKKIPRVAEFDVHPQTRITKVKEEGNTPEKDRDKQVLNDRDVLSYTDTFIFCDERINLKMNTNDKRKTSVPEKCNDNEEIHNTIQSDTHEYTLKENSEQTMINVEELSRNTKSKQANVYGCIDNCLQPKLGSDKKLVVIVKKKGNHTHWDILETVKDSNKCSYAHSETAKLEKSDAHSEFAKAETTTNKKHNTHLGHTDELSDNKNLSINNVCPNDARLPTSDSSDEKIFVSGKVFLGEQVSPVEPNSYAGNSTSSGHSHEHKSIRHNSIVGTSKVSPVEQNTYVSYSTSSGHSHELKSNRHNSIVGTSKVSPVEQNSNLSISTSSWPSYKHKRDRQNSAGENSRQSYSAQNCVVESSTHRSNHQKSHSEHSEYSAQGSPETIVLAPQSTIASSNEQMTDFTAMNDTTRRAVVDVCGDLVSKELKESGLHNLMADMFEQMSIVIGERSSKMPCLTTLLHKWQSFNSVNRDLSTPTLKHSSNELVATGDTQKAEPKMFLVSDLPTKSLNLSNNELATAGDTQKAKPRMSLDLPTESPKRSSNEPVAAGKTKKAKYDPRFYKKGDS